MLYGTADIFRGYPFALAMGPQRAGTSWLDLYMRSRGDICMPSEVKEIFFFDQLYARGLDFYADHFKPGLSHKLIMEISTTAFDTPRAPANVHNAFGQDLKLLCPLRNPIYRSYSLYRHYLRYGLVRGGLPEAVEQIPQIVTSSYYADHYARWREQFPDIEIPVVLQEDMEVDLLHYVEQVCCALDLDDIPPDRDVSAPYNVGSDAKSRLLAYMAQRTGDVLRRNGLYKIINLAKKAGLKTLVFGREAGDQPTNAIAEADYAFLHERLAGEIERFEAVLGHSIPQWHEDNKDAAPCCAAVKD